MERHRFLSALTALIVAVPLPAQRISLRDGIGDTVTVDLIVKAFREKVGIALVETNVTKSTGEVCVKGEATIMTAKSASEG